MGFKTQQSSSNDHQQSEPLKCPRCSSTNTKFCYYNNYNKSQPRHFCKSCKRHWTKGGILRTVPVGGGRKNKRPAATSTAAAARARQDYHFSTTGLYNVSAPLNPSTQSPVFSSSSNFGMNVSVVNPASYQSLNDDRIDDHYYPKSSDSMEESSTITSTVNIPSSISSGSWPDPGSMGWPEYWHWNEIDDHVLAGLDCLSTSWADVLAEISNPKN